MIDLTLMSIDKIIIHYVPNLSKGVSPNFSTELTQLDQAAKDVLVTRITDVMGKGSNCVEMKLSDTTDVSAAVQFIGIMADDSNDNFISKTTALAQKLYQAQSNNRIPDGILVCVSGRTGAAQQQFVAVIKAESQSGFHVATISNIHFLTNLFLTETQRLYKIGFCNRNFTTNPPTSNDLSMYIFDQNAIHSGTADMANYFARSFLGCIPLENASRQTEAFYDTTKDFIMKNPSFSDEQKVELTTSLHVYLKDQTAVINSQQFANTYFDDPVVKDQYMARLEQEQIPSTAITKDTSRIKNKLRLRRMKFNSGIKISFPSNPEGENMNDMLHIDGYNEATDFTTIKIKGRIESQ